MGKQKDAVKYEVNRSSRNPTNESNSIWEQEEEIKEEVEEMEGEREEEEEEMVEEEEEVEEVEEEEEEEEVEEEGEEEVEEEDEEEVKEAEEEEEVEEEEEEEVEEVEEVEEGDEEEVEEVEEEEEEEVEEDEEEIEEEDEEEVEEAEEEEEVEEEEEEEFEEVEEEEEMVKEKVEEEEETVKEKVEEEEENFEEVEEEEEEEEVDEYKEEEPEEEVYEGEAAFKEPEKKPGCCTKHSSTKMFNQKQPNFQENRSKKRQSKWDVKEETVEKTECEPRRKKKSKWSVIDSQISPGELNEDCKVDETFKEHKEKLGGCIDFDVDSCTKAVDKKCPDLEGSRSKKKRSKWDMKEKGDNQTQECSELSNKRRKSRWSNIDSQLSSSVGETNIEIANLYAQLLDINEKMQSGLIGDDEHVGLKQSILSKIFQKKFGLPMELNIPKPPAKKYSKKLYIPIDKFPEYNFVGLLLGPCGNTQKKMEVESGASIKLRGRGSSCKAKRTSKSLPDGNQDLHVFIEADSKHSLDTAVAMVEKLLIPVDDGENKHKLNQLIELAEIRGSLRGGICTDKNLSTPNDDDKNEHTLNQFDDISKSKGMLLGQKCNEEHDPCDVCGNASHPTSKCILIAQTPQANSNAIPISTSMKPKKQIDYANLYIGYLPRTVDDNKLTELFTPFGPISQVKVMMDKTTNVSKGCGFVRYTDPISAAKAIAHMNGYHIEGKKLAVRIAGIPETKPQLAPLPSYPAPSSAVQNSSTLLHWPGPPESRPNPTSWPPPPQSIPNPTSWADTPELRLQNIAKSLDPVYGPGSSDLRSESTTMVQQNLSQTSWVPSDPWLPSTAESSFTRSISLPLYSGSSGYPYQNTASSCLLSSSFGASSSFQNGTSSFMLHSDSRASDELASFPGYLKSLDFNPTLERQSTPSKDLPSSVSYDLPLSSRSSYSSMFGNGQSFDLPPPVFSDLPVSSRSPYSSMFGYSQNFGSYPMPPN